MTTTISSIQESKVEPLSDGLPLSKIVDLVRIAETAERYEDMCVFVKKLVKLKSDKGEDLDVDERNLLSVAYKNVVGQARSSWRTLNAGFDDCDQDLINKYKGIIERQLEAICLEIIDLLTENLCETVKDNGDETEVFYLKMCGDYYRYMSEFNDDEKYKKHAEKFYKQAMDVAEANLNETHPTRLGLALNFSVCYYEILKEPEKACDLAKKSFDAAIEKLDTLNDASYKDSTLIMQLLRDNLTLWTSNEEED
jgi:hypothetical protein